MKSIQSKFSVIFVVIGILLITLCLGLEIFFTVPYYLLAGWIHYLIRVVPQIDPDPATVATAFGCIAVVIFGVHWFARWLHGSIASDKAKWSCRWTARIVTVVVLMFTVGIAAVGVTHQTAWLATSREPIFTRSTAAPRMISQNNLKQHGLAVHSFAEFNHNRLPNDSFTRDGRPLHSWQTILLPYLDQDDLFKKMKFDQPWNHPNNFESINTQLRIFQHPSAESKVTSSGLPATHYAANSLSFGGDQPRRLADYFKGTSNTILIGEAVRNPRSWADPLGGRDPRLGLNHPNGFGSPSNQKATQFVFADGSVRSINFDELHELLKD